MSDQIEEPQDQANNGEQGCSVLREAAMAVLFGCGAVAGAAAGAELAKHKNEISDIGKAALGCGIAGGVGAAIGAELAKHKDDISEVGKAVLEGGVAGAVGVAAGRAISGHEKEIKVGVDTVKNEIVSTPNDVVQHVKSKPVTAACEFLLCPPLVIVGAKIDKYLRK